MRILIVRTFPDIMNIESYNVQEIGLAKALIQVGHTCDIILYNGKNKDVTREYSFSKNGKTYTYKIYWLHGYNIVKNGYMPSASKIIEQYDVIQVDEYNLIYSWMLYTKPIRPTVIYHGLYYSEYTKGYNLKCKVFDQLFLRWRKHDNVVALTKSAMASDFLQKKGFRYVHTVGVGLDDSHFESGTSSVSNPLVPQATDKFRLLYIGKIEERRNSLFLLDVFQELLRKSTQAELIVVGSGNAKYVKRFKNKAAEFIESGNMIYIQKASQQELVQVYRSSHLFLFPSNYEIFGMVLLEAMYFGLPVISSLNGGSSVLIKNNENGRILEEFKVEHWVNEIESLMHNREKYTQIKTNASLTIKQRFLWDKLADKFLAAYEDAMSLFQK